MRFTMRSVPRFVALFCCLLVVSARAAEENSAYRAALESIKAAELTAQVDHLADPAMEGREAGTRGGHAAGDYLAGQYATLHLHGGGDNGGFFQPFDPNYRNVLVLLPGSDPKLRDQVIVVCAHYDHIGYGGQGASLDGYGQIHPGADDNASGTSAVLELGRALARLPHPPKRSILLAHWDAEEVGLLGSKHWVAHPTIPLDHVAAAINLDMVGRLRDNHLMVFGERTGYGWRRLLCDQNQDAGLQLAFTWTLKPDADHYPFFDHDIPVLLFHTGLHDEYHRSTDAAKLINGPGMKEVTRLLFRVVYELADRPATIAFRAAARYESPETEQTILDQVPKPADRLGVEWTEDAAATGGVVVANVVPGSPADRAGLLPGDCITRVADRTIASDDDFFSAVSAAVNPVALVVKRAGKAKPLTLTATLDGAPMRWGITWRIDDAEPGTIILTHVVRGSPAARAGLLAGDRIDQVADRDFADEAEFIRLAKVHAESLQLLIERNGRLRTVTLQHVTVHGADGDWSIFRQINVVLLNNRWPKTWTCPLLSAP